MERATVIPQVRVVAAASRREPLWADLLTVWLERSRQRRALRRLDDRMLGDIGLSRADIEREAGRPFWR